jgi:hypothetical protein
VCTTYIDSTNKMQNKNGQDISGSNYHKFLLKCKPFLTDLQESYIMSNGDKIIESPFLLFYFDHTKTYILDSHESQGKKTNVWDDTLFRN